MHHLAQSLKREWAIGLVTPCFEKLADGRIARLGRGVSSSSAWLAYIMNMFGLVAQISRRDDYSGTTALSVTIKGSFHSQD